MRVGGEGSGYTTYTYPHEASPERLSMLNMTLLRDWLPLGPVRIVLFPPPSASSSPEILFLLGNTTGELYDKGIDKREWDA